MPPDVASLVDELYRTEWGRIVAILIKHLGDFDLAEEYAQEAFTAALAQWSASGVPDLPFAWIIQTARNKAIDRIRHQTVFAEKVQPELLHGSTESVAHPGELLGEIPDERLRLIFTCCHPALATDAQVALTLRTLCGLTTDQIARAFLVPPATMAQRLVRAKHKIRDARIPYIVPAASEMPERLGSVLTVIYLVFNEGYAATAGEQLSRTDLATEAIRLGRLVTALMAPVPPGEAVGLLALMLLHDSRRAARTDSAGDIVVLEEQDRTRWDRAQIAEALPLVAEALHRGGSSYALQAAIAAEHCKATRYEDTDWRTIARLYVALELADPSPVVALNRAVASAMAEGPAAGLAQIDALAADGALDTYHLLHAARADLLRRMGSQHEAATSYRRALELVTNQSERRYLERRLDEVQRQGTT